MKLNKLIPILALLTISGSYGQKPEDPTGDLCKKIASLLEGQCENFASTVKTLADFKPFYSAYSKLNTCTRVQKPDGVVQKAEHACVRAGLHFASLSTFSYLIDRLSRGEKVCTTEYSSRIYELHERVYKQDIGQDSPQKLLLRALASLVMARCHSSLAERLLAVETRGGSSEVGQSDALKFLKLIIAPLAVNEKSLAKLPLDGSEYIPILEGELQFRELRERSIERGPSGYKLSISQVKRAMMDASKFGCQALNVYQNNILGSLGLLASLGYSPLGGVKVNRTKDQVSRIKTWTLASIVCQSLRGVMKLKTLTVEGKQMTQVIILNSQSADLEEEDQFSNTFASFGLREQVEGEPEIGELLATAQLIKPEATESLQQVDQMHRLKHELLQGPSYTLSRAIHAYIDITEQPSRRASIVFELLGLDPPNDLGNGEDDDDDDDDDDS